jgi:hypothetical protein
MGGCKSKRQYVVTLVFLVVLNASCISRTSSIAPIVVIDIILTENSILVEVEKVISLNFAHGLRIDYKNIPSGFSFDIQIKEERHYQHHTTMTLILDITDIPRAVFSGIEELDGIEVFYGRHGVFLPPILFSNQEAELTIRMHQGQLEANIFIGEDRIDILEQRFRSHRWR